jgi:hypothetical protein
MLLQVHRCKDRKGFDTWRGNLDFKLAHYDNQTRCGYQIFACGEIAHRAPSWHARKKNKPLCGGPCLGRAYEY